MSVDNQSVMRDLPQYFKWYPKDQYLLIEDLWMLVELRARTPPISLEEAKIAIHKLDGECEGHLPEVCGGPAAHKFDGVCKGHVCGGPFCAGKIRNRFGDHRYNPKAVQLFMEFKEAYDKDSPYRIGCKFSDFKSLDDETFRLNLAWYDTRRARADSKTQEQALRKYVKAADRVMKWERGVFVYEQVYMIQLMTAFEAELDKILGTDENTRPQLNRDEAAITLHAVDAERPASKKRKTVTFSAEEFFASEIDETTPAAKHMRVK